MFPFDADCSYCREIKMNSELNGQFKCEKHNIYISANHALCDYAKEAFRSRTESKQMRDISKSHGYYVVTAITNILNLDVNNEYLVAFKYLRNVYLPAHLEYQPFIEDYEIVGPILAETLENDEERVNYAEYLRINYLEQFVSLFIIEQDDEALKLYESMLEVMKTRYGLIEEKKKTRIYSTN